MDQILWACRTSPKEATNTTPFRLTYGHDAVLLAEICLQSTRIQRQHEIPSSQYWEMMSDEIIDLDEERMMALNTLLRQKEHVAKSYNKKVKQKTFAVDELVWKVILPKDRKDRMMDKWSPSWEGPFRVTRMFDNNAYQIQEIDEDNRLLNINGKYLKQYRPMLQEIQVKA